ncbi:NFX1-type zinc finger-containing protein 1-like isoform X2 [Babylonia areolata]|uniref:NFX1-type zinc finger-containing protein 1-like isoform X2 n=1 Tax=Babylonia areolata TaxID=304850 RepID=UPI003FD55A45
MEAEEPLQPRGPLRPRKTRQLTEGVLRELAQKSPQEILLRLASDGGGLDGLVRNLSVGNNVIQLLLNLIQKSFTPETLQSCHQQIRTIINMMLQTEFLNFSVLQFLMKDTGRNQDEKENVVAAVLVLVDFAITISPIAVYPKVFMFPDRLREKMRDLPNTNLTQKLERIDAAIKRHDPQQQRADRRSHGDQSRGLRLQADEHRADETFRALPLIPTVQDLTTDEEIFIRRNRDSGRYDDLEDYLDVQFRLFRADFIIPLRESIDKYLGTHTAEASRESGRGVRVYRDVQIVRPVCTERELAYRISFDVSYFMSVDWRSTQRLKYGSLLCLSSDNFQTYLCATVKEHDATLLSNGLVDVVFVLDRHDLGCVIDVPRDRRFVMVESPAYFEAYRHVLQGMKNLNDHNFPFIRYIVECQVDVNPPRYLQRDEKVKYDFRPLLDDKFIIRDEGRAAAALANLGVAAGDLDVEEIARNVEAGGVEVMGTQDWPAPADLKLDETQYQALCSALTKELAMVQGPPGTGKTYLGLKILKMLLHNAEAWNDPGQKRPILIVCYTNHALDQFLEAVLDFFQGSLVRVGGRSSSERLMELNLTNHRKRAKVERQVPMEVHEAKLRVRLELQKLKISIHEKAARLEIAEQEIVKEDFLKDFISSSAMGQFQRYLRKGQEGSGILKWLKLERAHERLKHQAEHRQKTLPRYEDVVSALQQYQAPHPFSIPSELGEEFDDDDDDDDETVDTLLSIRDNTQSRRLDIDDDDDDFFFEGIDFDDVDLDREETESERVKKRQREMEVENRLLRVQHIALDISDFCSDVDSVSVQDRTVSKPNKEKDKEVADDLKKLTLQYKRRLQALLRSTDKMTEEEAEQVSELWKMKVGDRWRLYRLWTDLYCKQLRGEIRENEEQYFDTARKYREILDQEDRSILEKQTVIGMTTTGAARYQTLLQEIGPRVIVVEEAAEVFEAHVVATLSRECQHLILIGDHKQLRPNPTVYDLARKGNLDVSLFERMVRNGFPLDCLGYQHRMRPQISRMMTLPELYPKLQDHAVVKSMPSVKGLQHNVFYVSHHHPEDRDEETKSYSNSHEAQYLVALCHYLLKQDYRRDQITLLTPYSGQIRLLGKSMPQRTFEGVRVSSVDNYQGEENDIVILSLVRSNNDDDIGFLKFDNRIVVALSRAKMGLYVVGNFEVLQRSSDLLRKVVDRAAAEGTLGEGLSLACQNHPNEKGPLAKTAADFQKAPEGGCEKRCDVRLPCGHRCPRVCHVSTGHEDMQCPMPCSRKCPQCEQTCEEDHACCEHAHCMRETEKALPRCGHLQKMPCGVDATLEQCQQPCPRTLACGHQCQDLCGQPCSLHCKQTVSAVSADCGHTHNAKCYEKDTASCSKECGQELVCGHRCRGTCGECRRGRLHVQCAQRCRKILVCGHGCQASCCQCPPCSCPCQNRCSHSRCDKKCGDACVPCAMKCEWQCEHQRCTQRCGEPCDRERCDQPCLKELTDCGHPCPGLCGETCPPICPLCDPEDMSSGKLEKDDRVVFLEDCCHVEEVSFLDRWVDMSRNFQTDDADADADADSEEAGEGATGAGEGQGGGGAGSRAVKFPECPQCKTPIRCNLRYGNVIKEALNEMEIIKQRCRGDEAKVEELRQRVDNAKRRLPQELKVKVADLYPQGEVVSESRLATQFYQITMAVDANQLLRQVSSAVARWPDMADTYGAVQGDLRHLLTWTLTPRPMLSDQEHFDVRQEFSRLRVLTHLLHARHAISEDDIQVEARVMRQLAATIRRLMAGEPLAENDLEEGRQLQGELKEVVSDPYTALSDSEREKVVRAISLPTGSWYACPRGHYYVIGECGRPTERASCPECHADIGGENHALVGGNRHAPEFDDAEGPRWSQEEDERYALMLQMEEWENWQ